MAPQNDELPTTNESAKFLGLKPNTLAKWRVAGAGPMYVALDEQGLHIITTSATRRALGIAVNPHAFRAAAGTSAAWKGTKTPNLASAILQHGDPRITDAHYNRARTFEATKALQKMLREG